MSYSFSITAETKDGAKAAVASRYDGLMIAQPVHAHDRSAVLANANAAIDLLVNDDNKDIQVSCNGYVTGNWNAGSTSVSFSGVSIASSASLVTREPK